MVIDRKLGEETPERIEVLAEGREQARWEGIVEICKTCDRKAQWPFCEHKTNDGSWYRLVRVREVGR